MAKHAADVIDDDPESPELTEADFAAMRPASEMLPPALYAGLVAGSDVARKRGQRGPGKKPAKVPVTVRLDSDVVDTLRQEGKGWQTSVADLVRVAVKEGWSVRGNRIVHVAAHGRGRRGSRANSSAARTKNTA